VIFVLVACSGGFGSEDQALECPPESSPECVRYCNAEQHVCQGQLYVDECTCLATCADFDHSGLEGAQAGDTVQCRTTLAEADECQNAGADSDVCSSNAEDSGRDSLM
jgi:hypothetical protein